MTKPLGFTVNTYGFKIECCEQCTKDLVAKAIAQEIEAFFKSTNDQCKECGQQLVKE